MAEDKTGDNLEDAASLETLRARFESYLMGLPGVVGVGTGRRADGTLCLKVYTAEAAEGMREGLPRELSEVVLLEAIGKPRAQ